MKKIIITILVMVAALLLYLYLKGNQRQTLVITKVEKQMSPKKEPVMEPIEVDTQKQSPDQKTRPECEFPTELELENSENLWSNIHYRKNGDVYRIKVFIDEGAKGSYRKLVHMKEDADGFAEILSHEKIKSDEISIIKKYIGSGEIIFKEDAISFGNDNFAKYVDGKIMEIKTKNKHCSFSN